MLVFLEEEGESDGDEDSSCSNVLDVVTDALRWDSASIEIVDEKFYFLDEGGFYDI